jgi:hypothetical protein
VVKSAWSSCPTGAGKRIDERAPGDAKGPADRRLAGPRVEGGIDGLELICTNRRRPAAAPTTPSSSGKASPYPLLGERPLELGERSENTEHAVVRQPKSLSFTEAASVWFG